MTRRALASLPVLAAFTAASRAAPSARSLKLSVRVEPLFPGLKLPQQMAKVAEAGYQGFEFGNWRAQNPAEIVPLARRLGIQCACIVGNIGVFPKGMGLCDPGEREGFLREIRASAEAAERLETSRMVTLTGAAIAGLPRETQHRSIVEGLKAAHDIVAPRGITLIVEPLNTLVDHKGYYLNHTAEAFDIMRQVDSPFVKILFDIYHVQIMDGNLIDTIRTNIAHIGHFHVGDVPGRHEPGTGEINYPNVFRAVRELEFDGFVAMEYRPARDAMATLAEVKRMASGT